MYFVINLIGVLVFLAVGVLLSKKRKDIHWRGVGSLLALNVFIAWFLTSFPIGRDIVQGAAAGFTWLVSVAYEGIAFAFPDWVHVPQMNFFTSAALRYPDVHRPAAICHQVDRQGTGLPHARTEVRVLLRHRDDVPRQHRGPGRLKPPAQAHEG